MSTYVKNESQIASDFYTFFVGFLEKFPDFKGRELYITGESFSGHYIPSIGANMLKHENPDINLKGIALGDGWVSPKY